MIGPLTSATFAINVADLAASAAWYAELLARPADLDPIDGIAEWELMPGVWLQLVTDTPVGRASCQTLRLGVADLDAVTSRLVAGGVVVDQPVTVPDVIRFCDIQDPDGNVITLYEVLAAAAEPGAGRPAPAG